MLYKREYIENNKKLKERLETAQLGYLAVDEENKRLNDIINKAIEYIENTYIGSILEVHSGYEEEYTKPLLDILKGEDKE